ncbi:MAG: murein biosynthesis integral membrane protein MurJ [Myxococcales bacterium]|nr:murein biosynthesis integral membrane protein MurJ [Myxococcales bacterium]
MPPDAPGTAASNSARGAQWVAAGILLSRIAGLVRERAFAHYFGNSDAGDAFRAALKIPNFLQNLFGEGVLSASFIPAYSRLLADGDEVSARRLASAVATILTLVTSVLVLGGVLATPLLIDVIAPGFSGEKRAATIELVQIFFPGTGLLVLSAWCLGILNSHRRFFLSYAAPVAWNAAIIGAMLWFGRGHRDYALAERVAWGLVVGSALQLAVQLPSALALVRRLRPEFGLDMVATRTVLRNFLPVVGTRGVVQVSAYVDNAYASLLPTGAVSALAYAQTLYLLPISLFGMSVTASQLPAMASVTGTDDEVATALRAQMERGLRQVSFFIVPSVVGLLAVGEVVVAALFQTGAFDAGASRFVWWVLGGYVLGLLAATQGRLYASAFYALSDTRTPLRYAALRVALSVTLGGLGALWLPGALGLAPKWGTVGLTLASGGASWVEFLLLRGALARRIGSLSPSWRNAVPLWAAAVAAGAIAWCGGHVVDEGWTPVLRGAVVLSCFAAVYGGVTLLAGVPEARAALAEVRRRLRRG